MGFLKFGRGAGRKKRQTKERLEDELSSRLTAGLPQEEKGAESLKGEVDRLTMVCRALWSFISEHHGLSEADLKDRIEQLGQQEGEVCTQCGRVVTRSQKRCLYCGAEGKQEGDAI